MDESKGKWTEELPSVLWAFRMTPRRSIGETPFSMPNGSEAMIPTEVGMPTSRTDDFEQKNDDLALFEKLDLVKENREVVMIKLAKYQQMISRGYNKNVKAREFVPGDLVLRKVMGNTRDSSRGKLGPTWEGFYRVTSIVGKGAYRLEDLDENPVP